MPLEFKSHSDEFKFNPDEGAIEGYASIFGNVDHGRDVVESKAFDGFLASGEKIKMLWQHDPTQPIGVWDVAEKRNRGLFLKGRILPEVRKGAEAIALLKENAIDGLSIGYKTLKSNVKTAPDGKPARYLSELLLKETSIVTFPMNPESTVTDVKQLSDIRDVEAILREGGVPNTFAKLVALYGFEIAQKKVSENHPEASHPEGVKSLIDKLNALKESYK